MSQSPAIGSDQSLVFRAIAEPAPGPQLRAVFDEYWPGYQRWMHKHPAGWPDLNESRAKLDEFMPELIPTYNAILDHFDHDPERARFLPLWCPTPIIRACSQAICQSEHTDTPNMVRNYDHAPHLCDAIILASEWGGIRAHAMTDCIWGALDGVNDAGLVVALSFGGRRAVGPGFSASLLTRYLLQTCTTVREACDALRRVPVYMSYNFTVLDRAGNHLTAFASPDKPLALDPSPVSTNHQRTVEWEQYAQFTQTRQRRAHLESIITDSPRTPEVIDAFLKPPLFRTEYKRASGTLYTVAYSPDDLAMSLHWQSHAQRIDPDAPAPEPITIRF